MLFHFFIRSYLSCDFSRSSLVHGVSNVQIYGCLQVRKRLNLKALFCFTYRLFTVLYPKRSEPWVGSSNSVNIYARSSGSWKNKHSKKSWFFRSSFQIQLHATFTARNSKFTLALSDGKDEIKLWFTELYASFHQRKVQLNGSFTIRR